MKTSTSASLATILPISLALAGGPATAQQPAAPLVLTGATVYDGNGGPPLRDANIRVENGRIACIGSSAECPVGAGARTVDLAGQFITPGLVDAHVHFSQTGWLDGRPDSPLGRSFYDYEALQQRLRADPDRWHRAYLCTGITAVYDVGGFPWTIEYEAAAEENPERAHVRAAGPLITHADVPYLRALNSDQFLPMGSDEEALASVRQLAEWGARAVKVWYLNPPAEQRTALDRRLELIGEEARRHGLPLIVHATQLRNAKAALRAGAKMLVHSIEDEPVDEEFLELARETGTVYAPTLLAGRNWGRAVASVALGVPHPIDDPNGCVDAETRRVIGDAARLHETAPRNLQDLNGIFTRLENQGMEMATMHENLRRVHRAGIPIATATDAGNPLTLHGPSIYQEMEMMQRAGIPPEEIIVMSTRNGARLMGRGG